MKRVVSKFLGNLHSFQESHEYYPLFVCSSSLFILLYVCNLSTPIGEDIDFYCLYSFSVFSQKQTSPLLLSQYWVLIPEGKIDMVCVLYKSCYGPSVSSQQKKQIFIRVTTNTHTTKSILGCYEISSANRINKKNLSL